MKRSSKLLVGCLGGMIALGIASGIAPLVLRRWVVEAFKIPSASMVPTLMPGDHVFVHKLGYRPRPGDVIVFHGVPDASVDYAKRVIAIAGDVVHWEDDGTITVNGVALKRGTPAACPPDVAAIVPGSCSVVSEGTWSVIDGGVSQSAEHDAVVPTDSVFVAGDYRSSSADSRFFGTVPIDHVVGRVDTIWIGKHHRFWIHVK